MSKPERAGVLLRLSDVREHDHGDDGLVVGLRRQERLIREWATREGWGIAEVVIENDLNPKTGRRKGRSAFKLKQVMGPNGRTEWRTDRPEYQAVLDKLRSGSWDGLIVLDLDRLVRDMIDLELLIQIVERSNPRIPVRSASGSLKLENDDDITMARWLCAGANKESRNTKKRMTNARLQQALDGKYGGGSRPYGFEEDGVTVRPSEAMIIEDLARQVVSGVGLKSLVAELRKAGVPTVTGARWSSSTIRDTLIKQRNIGKMVHQGKVVADAPWEPLINPEVYAVMVDFLNDPSRRKGPGPAKKWLGTGLYLCGICAAPTFNVGGGKNRNPRYFCTESAHLARQAFALDDFVNSLVVARLSRPDVIEIFHPPSPDIDVESLRAESQRIRNNLRQLAVKAVLGDLMEDQLIAATAAGRARADEIDRQLQASIQSSPLAAFVATEDVAATWDATPISTKTLIVNKIMTVTVLPLGPRGIRAFDPDGVTIDWKT